MNASLLTPDSLVLLIVGGVVLMISIFGVLAVIISMLNYEETPVRDRLQLLKTRDASREKTARAPFDDLKEALITFSGPLSKNLYGSNQKYIKEVRSMLTEAGLPDSERHVADFLSRRAVTGILVGAVAFAVTFVVTFGMLSGCLLALIGGFLIGSLFPQMALKNKAVSRKTEIRYSMPDTLDLMIVCVEAGLALDATIQRVADETERMAPEISYEMKRLNKELNAGISRVDAFQNMGQRVGVDEMRSLCAMIVQSDKMGTSVADTLRVYAEDLRTKRRQRAEELASKASIKMTFPLVFFIFPPLFIILMGPMVIQAVQQFFPPGG